MIVLSNQNWYISIQKNTYILIFLVQEYRRKCAHKMLVKLTSWEKYFANVFNQKCFSSHWKGYCILGSFGKCLIAAWPLQTQRFFLRKFFRLIVLRARRQFIMNWRHGHFSSRACCYCRCCCCWCCCCCCCCCCCFCRMFLQYLKNSKYFYEQCYLF